MTEKISIYKAGPKAIQKVLLSCAFWALVIAACGTTLILFVEPSEHFTWYWPAFFSVLGILTGLNSHKDTYSGLRLIGTVIGFLTGLVAGSLIAQGSIIYQIFMGLIFAPVGFIYVHFDHFG